MIKLTTLQLLILSTKRWKTYEVEEDNSSARIVRTIMEFGNLGIIPALISETWKNIKYNNGETKNDQERYVIPTKCKLK